MIKNTLRSFFRKKHYRILVISTLSTLIAGIFGFHYIEDWSWLDSVDYSVSTMVTTGNSGVIPKSEPGKIFNIFYMSASVILILLFINTIQQHFRDINESKKVKNKRRKEKAKKHAEHAIASEPEHAKNDSATVSP